MVQTLIRCSIMFTATWEVWQVCLSSNFHIVKSFTSKLETRGPRMSSGILPRPGLSLSGVWRCLMVNHAPFPDVSPNKLKLLPQVDFNKPNKDGRRTCHSSSLHLNNVKMLRSFSSCLKLTSFQLLMLKNQFVRDQKFWEKQEGEKTGVFLLWNDWPITDKARGRPVPPWALRAHKTF